MVLQGLTFTAMLCQKPWGPSSQHGQSLPLETLQLQVCQHQASKIPLLGE